MQYRSFGRLDWQGSALGFGCMRLPIEGGDYSKIAAPEAIRMLRHAIDHGVNYIDTAYGYHGGSSERVVGEALLGGYRAKVRLATKLPPWKVEQGAEFDTLLNEQLGKLQTDHIDFYLLHSLTEKYWRMLRDRGVLPWAEKQLAAGRIRHLGFSFHDTLPVFKEIVDATDIWTMCQIQYNYMDVREQAGTEGLQYAASKGLAVIVMEGLLGGRLVNPPAAVRAVWESAKIRRTPADWALQWLWSQPEVSLVLSGMSTMRQVEENLVSAEHSRVHLLADDELALVERVRGIYRELCPVPCTGCNYCQPCPNGVPIPRLFSVFNNAIMYNQIDSARKWYAAQKDEEKASACIQCRHCEELCPQHILIADWLEVVDEVLGQGRPLEACRRP